MDWKLLGTATGKGCLAAIFCPVGIVWGEVMSLVTNLIVGGFVVNMTNWRLTETALKLTSC